MVPDQPNTISPCSSNRLPWAGGFELPGLCCYWTRDTAFQGNRDRGEYLSYLESAQERYEPSSMRTGNVGALCAG